MSCGHLYIARHLNAGFGLLYVAERAKLFPILSVIGVLKVVGSFGIGYRKIINSPAPSLIFGRLMRA